MATTSQIQNLRIDVSDPPDIIYITIVADSVNLPVKPTPQTVYYVQSLGVYVQADKIDGCIPEDYEPVELFLSDSRINSLINNYGVDKAKYKAVILIASKLASKLQIIRNTAGADSTEYIKLLDLYNYYKNVADDFKQDEKNKSGNDSGRWFTSSQPEIAGGNL